MPENIGRAHCVNFGPGNVLVCQITQVDSRWCTTPVNAYVTKNSRNFRQTICKKFRGSDEEVGVFLLLLGSVIFYLLNGIM